MKIYLGKNKKEAKEITLKQLLFRLFVNGNNFNKGTEFSQDRFSDDSSSWIDIRQFNKDGAIDVHLGFDPETDNNITNINIYSSKFVLDEENMDKII